MTYEEIKQDLVNAANEAQEEFSLDELEKHAEKIKKKQDTIENS